VTTNSQRARSSSRPNRQGSAPLSGWLVGGIIAAVIAVAAVVAVTATAGGDEASTDGIEQTRPVTITGDALPAFDDTRPDDAVGLDAPVLSGASFDGTPVAVEPGAPTLVVFLAHWCPHCQREVPVLTEWADNGGVPDGVRVVAVATSTGSDRPNYPPSEWLEREGFPFPVLADSSTFEAATAYGLTSYPYFVVVGSDGRVVARASGEIAPEALSTLLDSVE
jgi:cytochrome c biogenesis protein CcmG/thiol:disulfide interchange protein DsbE